MQLEKWQDPRFLDPMLSPHYRDDLEYHGYERHAVYTADKAVEIGRVAIAHGVEIDITLFPSTGRGHDAGKYLIPGRDHPWDTEEEHAADVTARTQRLLGMPAAKINHSSDVIKSTNANVLCKTDTAKCLRQADLDNLIRDPIVFLNATYRLYKESKRLKEEPVFSGRTNPMGLIKDLVDFGAISHEILSTYLAEDISLGDFDRDREGRSLFALRAAANVNLLVPNRLSDFLSKNLAAVVNYQPIGL